MVVVTTGVAIASYGELNFVALGVMLQLLSVCTESTRLTLVQILLQRRGLSLNPITTVRSCSLTSSMRLTAWTNFMCIVQAHCTRFPMTASMLSEALIKHNGACRLRFLLVVPAMRKLHASWLAC